MSKAIELLKRRWEVAEYFHGENAGDHLDDVELTIFQIYNEHRDGFTRAAFTYYLAGLKVTFSTGICGNTTGGFGKLDENGYWQFPLPEPFVKHLLGEK